MKKSSYVGHVFHYIFAVTVITLLLAIPAFAVGTVQVKNVETTENTATLTWYGVSGAKGYRIYSLGSAGELALVGHVGKAKTTFTVKNLEVDHTYRFRVVAYDQKSEGQAAKTIRVTPRIMGLEQVRGLIAGGKDQQVKLRWTKNANADGYIIYRMMADGTFAKVGSTKKNRYNVKNLKNGHSYSFKVASWKKLEGKKVIGDLSDAASATPISAKTISKIHMYYIQGTMRARYRVKGKTFRQGEKVTVVSVEKKQATLLYKKKKYVVPARMVKLSEYKTNYKKAYSSKLAEIFVNFKGYSSKTQYFIWVSTYGQHVYVFKGSRYNWKLVHRYLCSTGMFKNEEGDPARTPSGKGVTGKTQYLWYWAEDQVCYYCVDMKPGGFFHSWLYHPDGSIYPNVGKLGYPSSHGCVRLKLKHAKWLYDNIPEGTSYIVF